MNNNAGRANIVDNRQNKNQGFLFGSSLQRVEDDEEDVLQGKMSGTVQRVEEEDDEVLQGKMAAPAPKNETGLPDDLKAGVENLSGFSLDDVRVHYNSSKPATVQALAYTQGTDIHVAPGQEKHLPHEAWHVAQQMAGRVSPTTSVNGMPVNDNAALEHEADVMGTKASAGSGTTRQLKKKNSNSSNAIQCIDTLLLNAGAPEADDYEIGIIMFGSSRHATPVEQSYRQDIATRNPAFAGIIDAGHTMLHGSSPDTMFSYGFWTDNMGAPGLAPAFNQQMDDDRANLINAANVQGVAGEYRNDTHLSAIMGESETRVVIRVSRNLFLEWQRFVVTNQYNPARRYTFYPGTPYDPSAGYQFSFDNCVSFAIARMHFFIMRSLVDPHTSGTDRAALLSMLNYILSVTDRIRSRFNQRDAPDRSTGLQGTILGATARYQGGAWIRNGPSYANLVMGEYRGSTFNGSIHEEQLRAYAREDYNDLMDIIRSSAGHISDAWLRSYIETRAVRRVDSLIPRIAGRYDVTLYMHYLNLYVSIFNASIFNASI